jgi:Cu/Ag efflux protein CusF
MTPPALRLLASLVLLAAAPAGALAQPAAPAGIARSSTVTSIVESVDQTARQVLLRGPEGRLTTVNVPREVRNLRQMRAGDRVVIEYREALVVDVARPGAPALRDDSALAAVRQAPGQRPGMAASEVLRMRVRIDQVDAGSGTVTFTHPQRGQRTVVVRDPRMLEFARQLRPGDEVDVGFAEAAAIRVEPAPR